MGRELYSINHVSQSNPQEKGQDDMPALLRRVPSTVADLGDVHVQDLTFHQEIDDGGEYWPSVTVYFHARGS